jgi:hypothetical protein
MSSPSLNAELVSSSSPSGSAGIVGGGVDMDLQLPIAVNTKIRIIKRKAIEVFIYVRYKLTILSDL